MVSEVGFVISSFIVFSHCLQFFGQFHIYVFNSRAVPTLLNFLQCINLFKFWHYFSKLPYILNAAECIP